MMGFSYDAQYWLQLYIKSWNRASYIAMSVLKVSHVDNDDDNDDGDDEGDYQYNADDNDDCGRDHLKTSDLVQLM